MTLLKSTRWQKVKSIFIRRRIRLFVLTNRRKTIGCVEPWLSGGFHHSSRTQQQWKMVHLIVLLPSGFELQYGAEFQSENEYDHRLRDGVL